MTRPAATLFVALAVVCANAGACADSGASQQTSGELAPAIAVLLGTQRQGGLSEASGVVRSPLDSTVFWSQNDSGNDPELFAYDSTGEIRGFVRVIGARNTDWEAIANGPCEQGTCLYIGDIGDNRASRETVRLLRFAHPAVEAPTLEVRETLRFSYPDGPRDVEAMWVGADTSVWLLSKRPVRDTTGTYRPSQLYRLPAKAWRVGADSNPAAPLAELVDSLPIIPTAKSDDWITDASLSPAREDGERLLAVLTYRHLYIFTTDAATGRPGALRQACALPFRERNAEGIAWLGTGAVLVVNERRGAPLYAVRCP